MKKKIKCMILVLCLIIFTIVTYKVVTNENIYIDDIVYNFMSDNVINDKITNIVKIITNITSPLVVIVTAIILIIFIKNKKIKLSLMINLIGVTIINNLFKVIIARPRPDINRLVDETGYSFPSGHAITSMVFYGYLIYLIYKYVDNRKIKIPLMIFLILLIPIIGLSRIYLGVHYASDVLGGFLISMSYLIVFVEIVPKLLNLKGGNKDEKIDK